ncbi:hypothetical protein [Vitreimonas flagellata]|uniref:hypothetical protein n=1 Tax=Vitreimonas flagellata TaxID=2560861 RepID=UPI001074FFD2|nr:hypothetical protein [Vitreimonas flagellata]
MAQKHKTLISDDGTGRLSLILVLENGSDVYLALAAGTSKEDASGIAKAISGKVVGAEIKAR